MGIALDVRIAVSGKLFDGDVQAVHSASIADRYPFAPQATTKRAPTETDAPLDNDRPNRRSPALRGRGRPVELDHALLRLIEAVKLRPGRIVTLRQKTKLLAVSRRKK